jgi:preprotein translocase subunit SecA
MSLHHVSLEDPLLRTFAGEWVQGVLQRLGMKENEAIESRMVTRRLQVAAQKIESQAISDMAADSAEEWLQRNCPDLWRKVEK